MKSFLSLFSLLWVGVVPFVSAADDVHTQHMDQATAEVGSFEQSGQFKYVCPMHPQIVRDHPGTCPICGMELVKQVFEQAQQSPKIALGQTASSGLTQGLAIRTTQVQKTTLWKYIPTFGRVTVDESKVSHIHPRASGWIRDLSVRTNGEPVKKGQLLYRFYSPEILSAQQDYLLAFQNTRAGAESLRMAAKTRLQLLGVDDESIKRIQQSRHTLEYVPIYAPQDGVVSALTVQNGMYVQPGTELMNLADLSSVWVEVEVLPLQQDWLKNGLTVNLTNEAYPDVRWEGDIEYLYPQADAKTQAVIARVSLLNADGRLKPNMFMNAEIYGGPKHNVLAIPLEAVIDDGEEKRVVRQLDDGSFDVVKIETGMQTRGVVEVVSGLSEDARVVVSGQFLIDSESQIQSNLRRLMHGDSQGGKTEPAAVHNAHVGH